MIEGSRESDAAGEYVIDVAEYSGPDEAGSQEVRYFQLKHSTKRKDQCLRLSDLAATIRGFGERYSKLLPDQKGPARYRSVGFTIVTNRPISEALKQAIAEIREGRHASKRLQATLERYTLLADHQLRSFCASLELVDGEGDYSAQRHELHAEIAKLVAGPVESPQIDSIISLVQDRALPHSDGRIVREDVLKRFGVTSERDLFPAPPELEQLDVIIRREQYETLRHRILEVSVPVIIHAQGGVGKSVAARYMANSLPSGSLGIVYDCFGAGKYRNRSEPRHRHRDALVQIANEIASQGLCDPLIVRSTDLDDAILRAFLARLQIAATALSKANQGAVLLVLIDAADNAEMAARESGESCFVHELLREQMPDGCRVVALCRTERAYLLEPSGQIEQLELTPFCETETQMHLRLHFRDTSDADGLEFHRLTGGNPRVQANALRMGYGTISEVLAHLRPSGTTVSEQIASQLDSAVSLLKDRLPLDFQRHIESVCLGLANLPPFVPIKVLSAAAEIGESEVRSFVADLGWALWLSDSAVQFRDEPTETWFRRNFAAGTQQIKSYVANLKPLASKFPYVAEILPSLLLQSEQYDELIGLALSDELLPEDSPIDKRNVRVYRLQFAFRAAVRLKRYVDAAKLALRAGEEVAGDHRQLELLRKNTDLIAPLQSEQRVQELAFRRMLRSGWDGSENIYSAALLSSVKDFQGEARSYLRAAHNWLGLYFAERKKRERASRQDDLKEDDIAELAFAHFNVAGPQELVRFILSWRPPETVFRIARLFLRRLVDAGDFASIDAISRIGSRYPYLMIAVADELLTVGRYPPTDTAAVCLDILAHRRARIPKPRGLFSDQSITSATVSFAEACAAGGLPAARILRILRHYVPQRASRSLVSTYQESDRSTFLRAVSLRAVLSNDAEADLQAIMPKELLGKSKGYQDDQDVAEFKQVVGGMLPWFVARARTLVAGTLDSGNAISDVDQQSKTALGQRWRDRDPIPSEIARVRHEILVLSRAATDPDLEAFGHVLHDDNWQPRLVDRINALRAASRLEHLASIRTQLERSCREVVMSATGQGPEEKADWYVALARAVLPVSRADARAYFDCAIEAVSRFGDEVVERWQAAEALAKRAAEAGPSSPELAYRFIRCAELVGDNAGDDYFDRNSAIVVCGRLHPPSALAALSRWRDRDIGRFDDLLPALAAELVSLNVLAPAAGWSLSAFFTGPTLDDFALLCMEREANPNRRQHILDEAVHDLQLHAASETDWRAVGQAARQYCLESSSLEQILACDSDQPKDGSGTASGSSSRPSYLDTSGPIDWEIVFGGLDLKTAMGLSAALQRFESTPPPRYHDEFWQEAYKRVDEGSASTFLEAIAHAEHMDLYDVRGALLHCPAAWRDKVSVRACWSKFLRTIARRFASELTNSRTLTSFLESAGAEPAAMPIVREGIMEGLSESSGLSSASTFFGFAGLVSAQISPQQATDLLDFSMSRFEEHVDDHFADGLWAEWLYPGEELSDVLAGFVWSALGSPRSGLRWRAAHCVRRLAEVDCEGEIDALIRWMREDRVGPFGSNRFPFYNLHARLYLLIALARVAKENPRILLRHHRLFRQYALEAMPHVLVQRFSAEIALAIENESPGTYDATVLEHLSRVGVSQMPVREIDRQAQKLLSPWHIRGEIDQSPRLYLAFDFDRYWFEPLADVFGISAQQVEELARQVVLKDWHFQPHGDFIQDPRAGLWRSGRGERETWHDHSSYPRTDDYAFYLSYHAMHSVASKLVREMPVVHAREWHEEEWADWLHRHTLTRPDGKWLADRRDPPPRVRRAWLQGNRTEDWRRDMSAEDFLEGLLLTRHGETWLNVFGSWSDGDSEREESFRVSTALVSPTASQSLLNALSTCADPWDFKLPEYGEEGVELEMPPFELKGWIWKEWTDRRLDGMDPHAAEIDYPPLRIGEAVVGLLGLVVDSERREWYLPGRADASLVCEIWSDGYTAAREEPFRHGHRMSASRQFLSTLCSTLARELIIEVQIRRRLRREYRESEGGSEYKGPYNRIYLLSPDGELRDARTHYELGQSAR